MTPYKTIAAILGMIGCLVATPLAAQQQGILIDPNQPSAVTGSDGRSLQRFDRSRVPVGAPNDSVIAPNYYQPDVLTTNTRASNEPLRNAADQGNAVSRERGVATEDERSYPDATSHQYNPAALNRLARAAPVSVPRMSEFETFVTNLIGQPIRRFGSELLVPEARDFTTPPTTTVPDNYRINPGDEIVLGLTGGVEASNMRLVVDPEGRIFIPKVGAVRVGGRPYRDLQAAISRGISRQYGGFTVSVSMGRLHGITVYVTGFARTPGSYTVSSLSTLVNAVLAAGGPSAGGSFRSIQLRRDGQLISDFDLYDLLLKGDKSGDAVVQNGDVLFIAPAGAQIAAIGSVNNEAIYETKAGDTLNDVLLYAGGANTVADLNRFYLLDPISDQGWQEIKPPQARTELVRRGGVLRVLSAVGITQPSRRRTSLVTISGEVVRPGRYFVRPGATLNDVVRMAGGLTQQAYPFGAVFVRDSLRRQQKINYDRAVDQMKVTLTGLPLISATAQQTDAGVRLMAVNSLLEELRSRRMDGRLVLTADAEQAAVPGEFTVENNDSLYVPPRTIAVGVYGMVNSSADFRYQPGLRIRDYIALAGGYNRMADKGHIFVVRANGVLLGSDDARSASALPGDLIFVPVDGMRGEFWARLRDVTSVMFNGAVGAAAIKGLTQ